jgi:hypothetical protein
MSASRSALGLFGVCAVSFGGAYVAGTATRHHDQAKAPAPAQAAPAPARTAIADLAPAAQLPGLRVTKVAVRRHVAPKGATPVIASAVAARPVRAVAPARRPVSTTPVVHPAPARPAPTVRRQSTSPSPAATSKPSVAFFDDGG